MSAKYSSLSAKRRPAPTTVPTTAVTVVPTTIATTSPTTPSAQTAYNGLHAIPGKVEAEDFDNGGAGVAYSDTTPVNTGGAGRLNEAVDVATTNGVTGISWVFGNEWTEYTVQVATTGSYTANFRVSSPGPGQQVVLTVDGAAGCTVNVPSTGSYDAYTTVSAPLSLSAGSHVIRLTYLVGGYGENIDSFEILQTTTISNHRADLGSDDGGYSRANHCGNHRSYDGSDLWTGTLNPTMSSAQAASTAAAASSVGYAKTRVEAGGMARMDGAVPARPGRESDQCPNSRPEKRWSDR